MATLKYNPGRSKLRPHMASSTFLALAILCAVGKDAVAQQEDCPLGALVHRITGTVFVRKTREVSEPAVRLDSATGKLCQGWRIHVESGILELSIPGGDPIHPFVLEPRDGWWPILIPADTSKVTRRCQRELSRQRKKAGIDMGVATTVLWPKADTPAGTASFLLRWKPDGLPDRFILRIAPRANLDERFEAEVAGENGRWESKEAARFLRVHRKEDSRLFLLAVADSSGVLLSSSTFSCLSEAEESELLDRLAAVDGQPPLIRSYLRGKTFEEVSLYADAFEEYALASRIAPENLDMRRLASELARALGDMKGMERFQDPSAPGQR